jgi:hypothetical protein
VALRSVQQKLIWPGLRSAQLEGHAIAVLGSEMTVRLRDEDPTVLMPLPTCQSLEVHALFHRSGDKAPPEGPGGEVREAKPFAGVCQGLLGFAYAKDGFANSETSARPPLFDQRRNLGEHRDLVSLVRLHPVQNDALAGKVEMLTAKAGAFGRSNTSGAHELN